LTPKLEAKERDIGIIQLHLFETLQAKNTGGVSKETEKSPYNYHKQTFLTKLDFSRITVINNKICSTL